MFYFEEENSRKIDGGFYATIIVNKIFGEFCKRHGQSDLQCLLYNKKVTVWVGKIPEEKVSQHSSLYSQIHDT